MSEGCSHNCGSCSANCAQREAPQFEPCNAMSSIKRVIGVVSGKGGVGKSLVTGLAASAAQKKGLRVGILDADVTGPSIPKMFGIHGRAEANEAGIFPAQTQSGIEIISLNLLLEQETDPVVWRGPVIAGVVKQFWTDVVWGDLDVLFIDMPPGTGDVPLTVFQSIPVDGILIVTSPQDLVAMVVEKAVNMAKLMKIPILGIVENMAWFECPDCHAKHFIYGEGHLKSAADKFGIGKTLSLPIDPNLAAACDSGRIESCQLPGMEAFWEDLSQDL